MKLKLINNAPVVLGFALISLLALLLNLITGGWTNYFIFSTYHSSFLDPLTFVRLFAHCFGHANFEHFYGNMMIFMLLGPMLEEKYGSRNLAIMIALTAFISGIINNFLFPNVMLLGASGICFLFIILASITSVKGQEIPITFIIISIMYIGNEIYNGLFIADNVSQLTHIIGGACGSVFGLKVFKSVE